MEKRKEIGRRIKLRREDLKMSQEELGNKLFLNKSTIQRYETGQIAKIKIPIIHAMAKQLNVNPDWLVLKTDTMGEFEEKKEWYNPPIRENLDLEHDMFSDRVKILARHLEEIPDDDKEELINNIESTINMYLKAKGLK